MTDGVFLPCPTNDVFAPIQRRKRGRPPLPKRNVTGGGAIAPVKRAPRRPHITSSDAAVDSDLMSSPHKRRASRRRRAVDPEKELLVVLLLPDLNTREEPALDIRSDAEYESFLEAMGDDVHSDDEQQQLIGPAAASRASSPVVGLETPGSMRMDRMGSREDLMAGVPMSSYEVFVPAVRDVVSADEQKTPLSSTGGGGGGGTLVSANDHLMRSSEAARSSSAYMEYDADSDDEAFMEHLQQQQLYCSGPSDSSSSSSCNPRVELHVVSPSSCSAGDAPPPLLTVQLLERMIALLERHFELSRQFHLDRLDDTIRGSMDDATRIYQLCQQYLVDHHHQQQQQGSDTRRKRSDPPQSSSPLLEVCSLLRVTSSNLSPIVINGNSFTSSFSVPIAQSILTSVTSSSSIPSSVSNARRGSRSSSRGIALNNSSNSSTTTSSSSRIVHSTRYPGNITTSRTPLSSIVRPTAPEATASDDATLTMNAPRRYTVDRISTLLPFEWVRPALRHELYSTPPPPYDPDLSVTNRHTAPLIVHTTFSDEQERLVLKEIYGYWMEKRSRCTTSLVRCFHHYIMDQWRPDDSVALPLPADFSVSSMKTSYIHLQRMRKALDRARLITDRVRRRERLKRDVLRASSDDEEGDGDGNEEGDGDDDEDNSQLELGEDNGSAEPR